MHSGVALMVHRLFSKVKGILGYRTPINRNMRKTNAESATTVLESHTCRLTNIWRWPRDHHENVQSRGTQCHIGGSVYASKPTSVLRFVAKDPSNAIRNLCNDRDEHST